MHAFSKRTTLVLAGFFAAASLLSAGCRDTYPDKSYFEMQDPPAEPPADHASSVPSEQEGPVTFTDQNGEEVTVTPSPDGTETASYQEDGRSVTFRRADDGSLSVTDGAASLLAGIASGYLLARGFSGGTGHYDADRRRYTATTPYVASSPYVSSDSKPSAKAAPSKGTVSNRAGGFGSAGARSAAS